METSVGNEADSIGQDYALQTGSGKGSLSDFCYGSWQVNALQAAVSATAFMGVCGEIAAGKAQGPGTLQLYLYDVMYNLSKDEFEKTLRIECDK